MESILDCEARRLIILCPRVISNLENTDVHETIW